jgi:dTDP-4-amino-4,6-dideoxygalactose transaminase
VSGARDCPSFIDLARRQYTTSGRSAIFLALEALGIGAGDLVLVPSYHCPTMIAPVVTLGAKPLFYPIDDDGSPSRTWLDTLDTTGVRALLVAHFFGLPQPMALLRRWCDGRGVLLVEDCAHALFGRSDGHPVGSWGDAAIASLTKFLPVNEGGWPRPERRQYRAATRALRPRHFGQISARHRRGRRDPWPAIRLQ